jgi:serine/threonine-protein kinase ATR
VDVGPYVAVVSATLVIQWPTFSLSARQEARSILNYIFFEIGPHIGDFMEDFAETNGIKELSNMSTQRQAPAVVTWTRRMQALIRRTYNPNHFVILQALSEMKTILSNSITIMRSALRGDIFNPWIGDLMAALYRTSGREDQDAEPIRLLSYEVLGIVGAVDPDRYEMKNDSRTVLVSYFQTEEEAKAFAIHLMSDMLVDLYRSTNDVGYQGYIIFALQELARFCGFTPAVAEGRQAPVQARRQWKALPKHVLEVLTPLLGAGYVAPPQPVPQPLPIPIYPTQRHYREWLQIWAEHLISKVRGPFSQEVFGAFARVVRQGDAAIAYDLLPSLVLNIIISGGEDEVENLRAELLAVLQDQVDPSTTSSPEKKFLGASVRRQHDLAHVLSDRPVGCICPHRSSQCMGAKRSSSSR